MDGHESTSATARSERGGTEGRSFDERGPGGARERVGPRCSRCGERLATEWVSGRASRARHWSWGILSEPVVWVGVLAAFVFLNQIMVVAVVVAAGGLLAILALLSLRCRQCGKWVSSLALRRWNQGRCMNCGYDLTGNVSGRCPECGAVA